MVGKDMAVASFARTRIGRAGLLAASASVAIFAFAPVALADTASKPSLAAPEYQINPLDKLSITVFGVQDLTKQEVQVDSSGQFDFPLIGVVRAAGRTSRQIADDITARLGAKYLQDPKVSVTLLSQNTQSLTVEGAVTSPGVFNLQGRTSLLQALAQAKGPNNRADLRHIIVFREISGTRQALVYDLETVRRGEATDPELQANDTVVVAESKGKAAWRTFIENVGSFSIFALFR